MNVIIAKYPSLTLFEVTQFSPFSAASGERVADRPDEGGLWKHDVQEKATSPCPLPQIICDHLLPFIDEPDSQMTWGRGDIMNKMRNSKTDTSGFDSISRQLTP